MWSLVLLVLWSLVTRCFMQEGVEPMNNCPETPADPFFWMTKLDDVADVLYICNFQKNGTYSCMYTQQGLRSLIKGHHGIETSAGNDPDVSTSIPTFSIGDGSSDKEEIPIADIKIEFLSTTAAKITVYCSSEENLPKGVQQGDKKSRPSVVKQEKRWNADEVGFISTHRLDTPGPTIAKCYFKAEQFECFGVPKCPESCNEPCSGGEPWRGYYEGSPAEGFHGNVTNDAPENLDGTSNLNGALNDATETEPPFLFICPSDVPKENCPRWKSYYIFKEQFAKRDQALCSRLAYLLRQQAD